MIQEHLWSFKSDRLQTENRWLDISVRKKSYCMQIYRAEVNVVCSNITLYTRITHTVFPTAVVNIYWYVSGMWLKKKVQYERNINLFEVNLKCFYYFESERCYHNELYLLNFQLISQFYYHINNPNGC